MEMTAERLGQPAAGSGWRGIVVAFAPLALLLAVLAFRSELLIGEPRERVLPEFYPPVAVVFANTDAMARDVELDGRIEAERRVALRAEVQSVLLAASVRVGDSVREGQPVCLLEGVDTGVQTTLFSPIDGIVSAVNGVRGTVLSAGQPCVTVTDPSSVMAIGGVKPRHADIMKPGDVATVVSGATALDSAVRIIYPGYDRAGVAPRMIEVAIPVEDAPPPGSEVTIRVATTQVIPTLVPFRALVLDRDKGLSVRIVSGSGPTGELVTVPVTLVATAPDGFYVEGLPAEARLVVHDAEFPDVPDGEIVRIGRVG